MLNLVSNEVPMSELKCKVEKNAIPLSRLIGKNKLDALKNRFNSSNGGKITNKALNSLEKLASKRQKASQQRAEKQYAEYKAKKEAEKAKKEAKASQPTV